MATSAALMNPASGANAPRAAAPGPPAAARRGSRTASQARRQHRYAPQQSRHPPSGTAPAPRRTGLPQAAHGAVGAARAVGTRGYTEGEVNSGAAPGVPPSIRRRCAGDSSPACLSNPAGCPAESARSGVLPNPAVPGSSSLRRAAPRAACCRPPRAYNEMSRVRPFRRSREAQLAAPFRRARAFRAVYAGTAMSLSGLLRVITDDPQLRRALEIAGGETGPGVSPGTRRVDLIGRPRCAGFSPPR